MTGIDRACLAYVDYFHGRALAVVQRGGFTRVLNAGHSRALFALLLEQPADFRMRLLGLLVLSVGRGADRSSVRGALYFNAGHTGLDQSGHALWVQRHGLRAIYYVHDLIPITHPEFARTGEPKRHAARMRTVLLRAKGVIANSTDSIDALARFAQDQRLPMPPSRSAPLGLTNVGALAPTEPPITVPYFVTVGTIEGRKNHLLLLSVWRDLARRMGGATPKLVIIGQRGWAADDVFRALDEDAELRPHIVELGRCNDSELWRHIVHAQALLFPSFVEGQGLPLIEALSVGTPVIASDLAVFRETADDIPEYLPPTDAGAWAEMITAYARADAPQRAAQIARMAGFQAPTWERHFADVEAWLANLR